MAKWIESLSAAVDRISRIVITIFFMFAFLATVYQIFSRYVLQSAFLAETFPHFDFSVFNLTWIEEAIRYLFVWIVFLGIGSVYRAKGHAHVEFVLNYLAPKWKHRLLFFIEIANIIFFALLIYLGINILQFTSLQISPSLKLNMTFVYISVLVSAGSCFIHSFAHLTNMATAKRTDAPVSDQNVTPHI
ncbi:MAG: TRAP transporter small permease [Ectobacillus sp.]